MTMIVIAPERAHRIVVTGAASGLGRALVARLRASGHLVAGIDRTPGFDADVSQVADVSDADAVNAAVSAAANELGGLQGLAVCAGIFDNTLTPVHAMGDEHWSRTLAVNLSGAFNTARAVLPYLLEGGGSIVFVASVAAHSPQPGGAAYSASKAGVTALARSVALEYAPHAIRSNSVLPGFMATGMTSFLQERPQLRESIAQTVPLGRIAEPDEVAAVAAFLLSDEAGYLTGQEITVDGGSSVTTFARTTEVQRLWDRIDH